MSYESDYYIDQGLTQEIEYYYLLNEKTWVTKEGKEINVSDMSTFHIESCLKLDLSEDWKDLFNKELESRLDYITDDYYKY